jgi:hypothetical protein
VETLPCRRGGSSPGSGRSGGKNLPLVERNASERDFLLAAKQMVRFLQLLTA